MSNNEDVEHLKNENNILRVQLDTLMHVLKELWRENGQGDQDRSKED